MVANIEKRADPTKKERLVASKKAWNKTVKLLIAKLIAFKRSVNGVGDPDAMLPEVDLKDPFPVEFHTYLASIVDDYDKVIKGADFVMDLQDNFSVTRRKSRKELSEVAASIDNHDQLIVEASWWGSRAWAWFALHRLGKDARRTRLRMLSFVNKSAHALNTIEYYFTSKSPGSDVQAIVGLTKFINLYIGGYLARLAQLQQIDLKGLENSEAPQLPPSPAAEPGTEEIGEDIVSGPPPDTGLDINIIEAQALGGVLKARVDKITSTSYNPKQKAVITNQLKRLNKAIGGEIKASEDSIKDIYANLIKHLEMAESHPDVKKAQTEEEEYHKIAQNVLQRWWSRKMLKWRGGKVDDIKLQISDELRDTVKKLRELMDVIESLDRSTADIEDKTQEVSTLLKSAANKTIILADHYRLEWRMEPDPKKRSARLEENITSKLKKLMGML